MMDIDIQLKQTSSYETLKEVMEMITKTGNEREIVWLDDEFSLKICVKKLR